MKKQTAVSLGVAGAAAAVAAFLPLFVAPPEQKVKSDHGRDWMSFLPDDLSLARVAIPGTHDSATENIFFSSIARCQHLSISQQLDAGCRYLDLRLRVKGDRLIAVHGITPCFVPENGTAKELTLQQILDELYTFLRQNPSETILVSVKYDGGKQDSRFCSLFYHTIERMPYRWYTENRLPSVGEARSKAVLLRRFEPLGYALSGQNGGIDLTSAVWRNMNGGKTLGYHIGRIPGISGKVQELCLQDCYELGVRDKWFGAILPLLNRGRYHGELLLNFFSCTGRLFPVAAALPLNHRFEKTEVPTLEKGGILIFDFLDAPLAQRVYSQNPDYRECASAAPPDERAYDAPRQTTLSRYIAAGSNGLYRIFNKGVRV